MSVIKIRAALETAVAAMSPALATAWENAAFAPPVASTPYQQVFILWAEPENVEFGAGHRQRGILQITLRYPVSAGTGTVATRAELIRTTFYRGASFTYSGTTVVIDRTPEVVQGATDGDRFVVVVRVRFFANIM